MEKEVAQCSCGMEDLKLSSVDENEIAQRTKHIKEIDERIKDRREAIDSINKDLVEIQQVIIVKMAEVIDLNRMKKDREKEINGAYRDRDYNYDEIRRIRDSARERHHPKVDPQE